MDVGAPVPAAEAEPEGAADTAAGADAREPAFPGAGGAAAEADGAPGPDGEDEAGAKAANPYQQAIDQAAARAAEMTRRSSEKQADTDFLTEVRKLAAEIKQLVRRAAEEKPGGADALSPEEARELKAMVGRMDRDIEQASAELGGGLSVLV